MSFPLFGVDYHLSLAHSACHVSSQNAIRLQEKERQEREDLARIIKEADDYKDAQFDKRKSAIENGMKNNRDREKVIVLANCRSGCLYMISFSHVLSEKPPAAELFQLNCAFSRASFRAFTYLT